VPSRSESFGLVALEAQACGTPVVAAAVGGLPVAVDHDVSGLLVHGHEPRRWATALADVALRPGARDRLALGAVRHAARFSWERTTDRLLAGYAQAAASFRSAVGEVAV
jgi:D-inositol-3-phosphate glycosyltransferase